MGKLEEIIKRAILADQLIEGKGKLNKMMVNYIFGFPWSIWRRVMRGKNSKNKKKRSKNQSLRAVRGLYKAEKSSPSKGTSRRPTKCIYLVSASLLNMEGSYTRNKVKR